VPERDARDLKRTGGRTADEAAGTKMKHTTSRMLFAYWDTRRGERAAPERRDMEPGGMRHVLADAFILSADPPQEPAFRLAGTRLCSLFCRDMKGEPFHGLWPTARHEEADRLVRSVLTETVGLVAGLVGCNENGSELPLELLLLPLRHRGRTDARLIGSLSPASIPSWAGLVPLRTMETRSLRVIEPRTQPGPAPQGTVGVASAGRRSLFVVHEGGRL